MTWPIDIATLSRNDRRLQECIEDRALKTSGLELDNAKPRATVARLESEVRDLTTAVETLRTAHAITHPPTCCKPNRSSSAWCATPRATAPGTSAAGSASGLRRRPSIPSSQGSHEEHEHASNERMPTGRGPRHGCSAAARIQPRPDLLSAGRQRIQHRKADETMAKFEALIVEALTMLPVAADDGTTAFKNFHRSLCARFGYTHDENDWRRDLVSLEEWIAKRPGAQDIADAEAYRRINTPELHDFMEGMRNDALHQVERWGHAHDRSKSAENWYWLVGYLAGKALRATITGDRDKALHHTISSAAAMANWHAAISADTTGTGVGKDADLRPTPYPAHGEPGALEQGDAL